MDLLREIAPFLVGLLVPAVLLLARSVNWPGQVRFIAALVAALILGVITSALVGELAAGPPDSSVSVLIDTSLVYTGSQVAYRFVWRPVLEARLRAVTVPEAERK
jgi:hypothetical protein